MNKVNENIADLMPYFFDEYGNVKCREVVSVGRWHGHLVSVDGPKCKTKTDGIHDLYEWDYYGHPTGELTCRYEGCNIWLPYGEDYRECGVVIARVPSSLSGETDVSGKHAIPMEQLMVYDIDTP